MKTKSQYHLADLFFQPCKLADWAQHRLQFVWIAINANGIVQIQRKSTFVENNNCLFFPLTWLLRNAIGCCTMWFLAYFYLDRQLHFSKVGNGFWSVQRSMTLTVLRGRDVRTASSQWEFWLRHEKYWTRIYLCTDLRMNNDLWN